MHSSEALRNMRDLDFVLAEHGHHDPEFAPTEIPQEIGEPVGAIEFDLKTWDVNYIEIPKKT